MLPVCAQSIWLYRVYAGKGFYGVKNEDTNS